MGRPPVGKKAMTDAERQRRRRKRLAREKSKQERAAKQAASRAKTEAYLVALNRDKPWTRICIAPGEPPLPDRHDELAEQVLEAIALEPDLSVDGLLVALARRIGVRNLTLPTDRRDTAKPGSEESEQETTTAA